MKFSTIANSLAQKNSLRASVFFAFVSFNNVAALASDSTQFSRGEYLASIMLCKGCHTPMTAQYQWQYDNEAIQLAGGMKIVFPPYGTFYTKNLTPDKETGLGAWTKQEIVNAVKHGVGKDGRQLMIMPFPAFRHLNEEDTDALVFYIQSIRPLRHWIPPNEAMGLLEKIKAGLRLITPGIDMPSQDWYYGDYGSFERPPANARETYYPHPRHIALQLPTPTTTSTQIEHGKYLATISLCVGCHTPVDTGGLDPDYLLAGGFRITDPACGEVYSPNLTSDPESGLGRWSDEEIALAIRKGISKNHRPLCQTIMPSALYSRLTDADVAAIISYLRSLPPVRHEIPRSHPMSDLNLPAQRFFIGDAGK